MLSRTLPIYGLGLVLTFVPLRGAAQEGPSATKWTAFVGIQQRWLPDREWRVESGVAVEVGLQYRVSRWGAVSAAYSLSPTSDAPITVFTDDFPGAGNASIPDDVVFPIVSAGALLQPAGLLGRVEPFVGVRGGRVFYQNGGWVVGLQAGLQLELTRYLGLNLGWSEDRLHSSALVSRGSWGTMRGVFGGGLWRW